MNTYNRATDAQIWNDFLLGNKAAYTFMYQKYARVLYNYGYKIAQNRQLTEDCLQDLFLNILESRERLGSTDSIEFYLMRSLRRDIIRQINKEQRSSNDLDDSANFQLEFRYESSWLDAQITKEQSEALLYELNQLPARQKEAIFLKFFGDLRYEEIAEVMGLETTSAYKVVYKAIASLQKRVKMNLFY